jgi:hypothetical protein
MASCNEGGCWGGVDCALEQEKLEDEKMLAADWANEHQANISSARS